MMNRKRKIAIWSLVSTLLVAGVVSTGLITARANKMVNTDFFGVAIKGYDTVAYFTEGQPKKGQSQYEVTWHDARWQFANAKHRDLFRANPERYAPQYGGFCASYLAEGGIASVDPTVWVIIDDKLYLSWNKQGREELTDEDSAATIEKADKEWTKRQNRS